MKPKTSAREDARETPKKEKEKIPDYYQIESRDKCIPCFLYVGPTLEDFEASLVNKKEIKYKKIRIKGCPVTEATGKLNMKNAANWTE